MELYINDILIDLDSRIPFPLNFQINDIKEPQNKKSSTSNTVTLPGTANNVRTMSGVFTVTSVDSVEGGATAFNDFDPTIKATARYYEKGVLQFQGVCQLLDCIKKNGTWSFEVVLFEEVVDIFKLLSNYKLTELGWSEYNHLLNITNQENSWEGLIEEYLGDVLLETWGYETVISDFKARVAADSGTFEAETCLLDELKPSTTVSNVTGSTWNGEGYYYGLIDYGYDRPSDTIFRVTDLAPQVFVKNIVDKMFEKIDVSYTSTFFDNAKFKKLLMAYDGGEFPTVDSTLSTANSVQTDQLTDGSGNVVDITQNLVKDSQTPVFLPTIVSSQVEYNSNSATNVDPSSLIQSNEPFRFVAQQPGNYQLVYSGTIDIDLDFTPTSGGGAYSIDWFRQASMVIFKNNQPYQAQQIYSETVQTTSLTNNKSITGSFTFDLELQPSDYIQVAFFYQNEYTFQDNINAATAVSSTLTIAPVTSLDITLQQQQIVEGQLVNVRQFLPDTLTCADFFKGLINMFNLTVRPSETNPRLLEIEPLDDFYFGTQTALGADLTLDWTKKVDHSKEWRVTPTVNLATKSYKFSFAEDGDYWNTRYKNDTLEGYGMKELLSSSEFSVGTTEYKLPFSTKPLVQIGDTDLIIPQTFQVKTDVGGLSTKQPKKGKPFIVQVKRANAGILQTGAWTHRASSGDVARTEYPYVGHLDNLDDPRSDLLFDVPDYVFYNITGGNDYTTNNLYINHSKFLRELVDRNGKLLTCYVNLNADDINTLDFRRLIKIDGVVYRLQKIEGYDSGKYMTTKVELLKILEGENVATYTQVPNNDDKYSIGTIDINLDKLPTSKLTKSIGVDANGNMSKSNQIGNVVWVNTKEDLPTPISNIITLEANVTYFIADHIDLLGDRLVGAENTTIIGGSSENCTLTSTGLGAKTALFTTEWTTPIRHISFKDVGTALDIDGTLRTVALDWTGVNFVNALDVGIIDSVDNFIFTKGAFLNSGGIVFTGTIGTVAFNQSLFDAPSSQKIFDLKNTLIITRRFRVIYSSFIIASGETGLLLDASATIPTEGIILDTCNFAGSGTYLSGIDYQSNKALFKNNVGIINSRENSLYYMNGNATATVIAATGTAVKVAGTTTSGAVSSKFTNTDNRATYIGAIDRLFKITATLSVESGNNNVIGIYVAKNGTLIADSEVYITTNAGGRAEGAAVQASVQLSDTDYLEIWVENDTSTSDITVTNMNVIIE